MDIVNINSSVELLNFLFQDIETTTKKLSPHKSHGGYSNDRFHDVMNVSLIDIFEAKM